MSITLRIRTQLGTWRLTDISPNDKISTLLQRLSKEHNIDITESFTSDPARLNRLNDSLTVREAKLANGQMIYLRVDDSKVGVHEAYSGSRMIAKDGTIVLQDIKNVLNTNGFRPGMLPLRSMKMQWTLNEFVALDSQFEFKVQHQKQSFCKLAAIEKNSINDFQSYMRQFDFRTMRVAFMYGTFNENNSTKVEYFYEPPQHTTDVSFTLLNDPKANAVESISKMLGYKKVGWIFTHPPREKGFHFSGPEIIFAAEQQLEAAGGIEESPFVTVKVILDNDTQQISCEAFQVSKQCMEMVAEGVLEVSPNLGCCQVNNTFTALVEGKPAKEVDNNFFIVTIPIEQFESQILLNMFPKCNRIDVNQSRDDLKKQFSKTGKEGWTFTALLGDFQLLLYLTEYLSLQDDLPLLCKAVISKDTPLDDGYRLLLRSIAGLD